MVEKTRREDRWKGRKGGGAAKGERGRGKGKERKERERKRKSGVRERKRERVAEKGRKTFVVAFNHVVLIKGKHVACTWQQYSPAQ